MWLKFFNFCFLKFSFKQNEIMLSTWFHIVKTKCCFFFSSQLYLWVRTNLSFTLFIFDLLFKCYYCLFCLFYFILFFLKVFQKLLEELILKFPSSVRGMFLFQRVRVVGEQGGEDVGVFLVLCGSSVE